MMTKKAAAPESVPEARTHTVMLRLPHSLHVRLQEHARRRTLPPAVLARMLVLDGVNRLDRYEGE